MKRFSLEVVLFNKQIQLNERTSEWQFKGKFLFFKLNIGMEKYFRILFCFFFVVVVFWLLNSRPINFICYFASILSAYSALL